MQPKKKAKPAGKKTSAAATKPVAKMKPAAKKGAAKKPAAKKAMARGAATPARKGAPQEAPVARWFSNGFLDR